MFQNTPLKTTLCNQNMKIQYEIWSSFSQILTVRLGGRVSFVSHSQRQKCTGIFPNVKILLSCQMFFVQRQNSETVSFLSHSHSQIFIMLPTVPSHDQYHLLKFTYTDPFRICDVFKGFSTFYVPL